LTPPSGKPILAAEKPGDDAWGWKCEFHPLLVAEVSGMDLRHSVDAGTLRTTVKYAIDEFIAEHEVFWSRGQIGFTEFPPGERERYPPSRQRLVRRHPGSKRKALYLSAHASHIVGWPVPEGGILLQELNLHAISPRVRLQSQMAGRRSRHLDNRCTMHCGRPRDDFYPRDLRRAAALDVGSTLDEVA
jgi:alpha-ketoglutarate-dependent 2,4-dichlorophenoxyacetate dioxygenase